MSGVGGLIGLKRLRREGKAEKRKSEITESKRRALKVG